MDIEKLKDQARRENCIIDLGLESFVGLGPDEPWPDEVLDFLVDWMDWKGKSQAEINRLQALGV